MMKKETKIVKDVLDEVVCEIDSVPFIFHNEVVKTSDYQERK